MPVLFYFVTELQYSLSSHSTIATTQYIRTSTMSE